MAHPGIYLSHILHHHMDNLPGKASACISDAKTQKGSITLQTALTVPIFFFAVISLLYFMEMMAVRTSIRSGMQYAGKYEAEKTAEFPIAALGEIKEKIIESIGRERLDRSIINGGSEGISCEKTWFSVSTGILNMSVKYELNLPVPVFLIPPISFKEEMKVKGWTGFEKGGFNNNSEDIVYVAETGMVYHRDYHCTYLDLSIKTAVKSEIGNLRNENEGKYYACEKCAKGGSGSIVYITNTGDRYHNSLGCSGLKRTVYSIPISEAAGKGACSRCSGK